MNAAADLWQLSVQLVAQELTLLMLLQAHVSQLALPQILTAIENHPDEVDIQAKGLIVLGVLGQASHAAVSGDAPWRGWSRDASMLCMRA